MAGGDYARFANLTFDDFRQLAADDSLSQYQRIGFPDAYRAGLEASIFADLLAKLPALGERDRTIVDIGPGCSELPAMIVDLCAENGHALHLVDSEEMLALTADASHVHKHAGRFPDVVGFVDELEGSVNAVIVYSVLHYVYPDQSVHGFVDEAARLLDHGGAMLIGDLPNVTMRNRFMASPAGHAFHQNVAGPGAVPDIEHARPHPERLGDGALLGLVAHLRESGFHAWLVPQPPTLPMANRREDLLVLRP